MDYVFKKEGLVFIFIIGLLLSLVVTLPSVVSEVDCGSDEECEEGELCQDHLCVTKNNIGCYVDEDCSVDEVCVYQECVYYEEEEEISAYLLQKERFVQPGESIGFNALDSIVPSGATILWDFGDGTTAEGGEVFHTYPQIGTYTVTLTIEKSGRKVLDRSEILVFQDIVLFITDGTVPGETLILLQEEASKVGRYLRVISSTSERSDYLIEETLTDLLRDSIDEIKRAEVIISWTSEAIGLNVLSLFAQESDLDLSKKRIIIVTEERFSRLKRIAQGTFELLKPNYILISSPSAVRPIIENKPSRIVDALKTKQIPFFILNERTKTGITPITFLSRFVNFIVDSGVPINTVVLILMLPIAATIVVFCRQVIGISTFGVFAPSLIAVTFLTTGLGYGLIMFSVILLFGSLFRTLIDKFRLLSIPRLAIVLTFVSFIMLVLMGFGTSFGVTQLLATSAFPMLILSSMIEKFVVAQTEKGSLEALKLVFGTLGIALICFYVISWGFLRTMVVAYPELIIGFIIVNFFLGKWTGMRVTEYFRFKKVLEYVKQ